MFRVNSAALVDGAAGNANPILVASTGIKYTKAFQVAYAQNFSLSYILSSSGNPDVQLDLEESVDGNPPINEGAASSNFIIPAALASIQADLTTKTWNFTGIQPVTARWMRVKATGKNANASDTTLAGYVHLQEQID